MTPLSSARNSPQLDRFMTTFGQTREGRPTRLFSLQNPTGFRADISDYGGTIVRLLAPDRQGRLDDVVLGFDRVEDYIAHSSYLGCTVGRCGNRIARGKFHLDGKTYALATNNEPNGLPCHLHGGLRGFDRVLWTAEPRASSEGAALRLSYRSPDGEEGYPGNLEASVTFTVTPDNALKIDYVAETDRPTIVNLTNHSYFNLGGHRSGAIADHILKLHAARFTPIDRGMIPTGELAAVAGTPFDFTTPRQIGERIEAEHDQLKIAGGYDHNFVLDRRGDGLVPAAWAQHSPSGRTLEVLTTEPGLQLYSGNFLKGAFAGKEGHVYGHRAGFCLETQHFPDSPNQPQFPPVVLRRGETYRSTTVFRFGVQSSPA